jgi:hypothetical protein
MRTSATRVLTIIVCAALAAVPNCGAGPSLDKQQQAFEEAQADDPDEAGLGQSIGRRSCVAEQSGLAK